MNPQQLTACLDFIRQAGKLKDVTRSAYTSQGRQESTAEHTWRLCLMALLFEQEFAGIDFVRLLKICIVHDLGEAIHGDIPAIAQSGGIDKSARERADLLTLLAPLDAARRQELLALWEEYEEGSSAEARLAKGLDKLETLIQHNQGDNAPEIDYRFNLTYGQQYMDAHPLLAAMRELIDQDTRRRADG